MTLPEWGENPSRTPILFFNYNIMAEKLQDILEEMSKSNNSRIRRYGVAVKGGDVQIINRLARHPNIKLQALSKRLSAVIGDKDSSSGPSGPTGTSGNVGVAPKQAPVSPKPPAPRSVPALRPVSSDPSGPKKSSGNAGSGPVKGNV